MLLGVADMAEAWSRRNAGLQGSGCSARFTRGSSGMRSFPGSVQDVSKMCSVRSHVCDLPVCLVGQAYTCMGLVSNGIVFLWAICNGMTLQSCLAPLLYCTRLIWLCPCRFKLDGAARPFLGTVSQTILGHHQSVHRYSLKSGPIPEGLFSL